MSTLRQLIVNCLFLRLKAVDLAELESGDVSGDALRAAYLNADIHLLVTRCVDMSEFAGNDRDVALDALRRMRAAAELVRKSGGRVLFINDRLLQAPGSLDKTQRDHYCKAVAQQYREMMAAGAAIVRLDDPRLVECYTSRCAR